MREDEGYIKGELCVQREGIYQKGVYVKKEGINTHTTPTLIWIGSIPPPTWKGSHQSN